CGYFESVLTHDGDLSRRRLMFDETQFRVLPDLITYTDEVVAEAVGFGCHEIGRGTDLGHKKDLGVNCYEPPTPGAGGIDLSVELIESDVPEPWITFPNRHSGQGFRCEPVVDHVVD